MGAHPLVTKQKRQTPEAQSVCVASQRPLAPRVRPSFSTIPIFSVQEVDP